MIFKGNLVSYVATIIPTGGAVSDVLKQVTLKVISKDRCKKIFENSIANGVPVKIENNMLCVSVSPGDSSCEVCIIYMVLYLYTLLLKFVKILK